MLSQDDIKKMVGKESAGRIQEGMTVGIGSGSTAYWLMVALAERIKEGLTIKAVPTSIGTRAIAERLEIPLVEFDEVDKIDIAIDGADEIDKNLQLIKGGGGSLLQEKMVADSSLQFIVIADEKKQVEVLGSFPLPVEVIPYGWRQTKLKIERVGTSSISLRKNDEELFITDHGHFILDCHFTDIHYPATLHSRLNNIPGVVDNGLFINMADIALIGHADGTITEYFRGGSM